MDATLATPPIQALDPGLQAQFLQRNDGRAAAALRSKMISLREELEASGVLEPATVINFNPLALRLDGDLSMTVPACDDVRVPKHMKLEFEFNGRRHIGSYLTLTTPKFWPKLTAMEKDSISGEDVARHDIAYMLPIGIAYQFFLHYNDGANDSTGMGGVLIFKGNRHAIEPPHLSKSGGKIDVPQRKQLSDKRYTFFTQPRSLKEELTKLFERQRRYVDMSNQEAQNLFDGGDVERKNITQPHRILAQYALDMGWRKTAPAWLTAKMGEDTEQIKCLYCQTTTEDAGAHFCAKCNAPYDAYKTFMAGLVVPEAYLMNLKGDQREDVIAELHNRRKGFGMNEAPKPAKKKED